MNTRWSKQNLGEYVDGELAPAQTWAMRQCLLRSEEAFEEYEEQESSDSLGALMRHLSKPTPPPDLRTRIRLAVSRESAPSFWSRWKLHLDNLLRPLALPATGGVLTAVLSFVVLISSVGMTPRMFAEDVPLAFFAKGFIANPEMMMPSPFGVTEETVVLAFIDGEGSVYDFRVISNEGATRVNAKLAAQLATALVTTRFEPAMNFGRPVLGTMLITFRPADRVEVRG